MHIHIWPHAVPSLGPKRVCGVPLEIPRAVAKVHTGQVIMSIYTKLQNKGMWLKSHTGQSSSSLAARRSMKKWGFTKFNADEFEDMVAENQQLILDGCGVNSIPNHGPLDKWLALLLWRLQHYLLFTRAQQ